MFDFLTSGFYELLTLIDQIDATYIYLILFAVAFIENIFPPIPGDTFTLIGGYLAMAGKLSLTPTFLFILSGTMCSIMLVYALGYRSGREFFVRKNYRFFSVDDLGRIQGWFDRWGAGIVLASRFVVGARVAIAVGAGISRYRPVPMAVFSLISSALFHGLLIVLVYGLRAYIDRVSEGFDIYSKIILVMVAGLIIIWFVFIVRRYKYGKKETKYSDSGRG